MKFSNLLVVYDWQRYSHGDLSIIDGLFSKEAKSKITVDCSGLMCYPALINACDHLVDNWLPKAAAHKPYKNIREWHQDIKDSAPIAERSKFWKGEDYTDLTKENALDLAQLGVYKNIFAGVTTVFDHLPLQKETYYQSFPINIISKYMQTFPDSLKDWWGVKEAQEAPEEGIGKMPFIVHLADWEEEPANVFDKVEKLNLLRPNSIFVHCLSLKDEHFKKIADTGASVIWTPNSNIFLFEKTMDIESALANNVNICIGTASTLSGSINLIKEMFFIKKNFPSQISYQQLFKMVTENSASALILPNYNGKIEEEKDANLLITKKKSDDPYENLCDIEPSDIQLLLYQGEPIYGKVEFLKYFSWDAKAFYLFNMGSDKAFIIGHPDEILTRIEKKLGYKKHFDYLPF
jgi:hypothetical protein